ncbi:MAG: hypothetical protein V3S98_06160 [Dehalococcoidia bacterium]
MKPPIKLTKRSLSLQEFFELLGKADPRGMGSDDLEWLGGKTPAELCEYLDRGDDRLAATAENTFDSVLAELLPDTEGGFPIRVASPCGAFPNVGAFLAGRPDSMFGYEPAPEMGPVKLVLELTCSAVTSHAEMLARGVAFIGLAYALQTIRPVEVYVGVSHATFAYREGPGHEHATAVRVSSTPLDLSRLAAICTATGAGRYLIKDPETKVKQGGWPETTPDKLFDLGPDDIYLPGPKAQQPWVKDPVGTLKGQIGNQIEALLSPLSTFEDFC